MSGQRAGPGGSALVKSHRSSIKIPTRFIPKKILGRLEAEVGLSPRGEKALSPRTKSKTLDQIDLMSEWMSAERAKRSQDSIHDVLEGKMAELLQTSDDQLELLLEWVCPDLDPSIPVDSLADFSTSGPVSDTRTITHNIQSSVISLERVSGPLPCPPSPSLSRFDRL